MSGTDNIESQTGPLSQLPYVQYVVLGLGLANKCKENTCNL